MLTDDYLEMNFRLCILSLPNIIVFGQFLIKLLFNMKWHVFRDKMCTDYWLTHSLTVDVSAEQRQNVRRKLMDADVRRTAQFIHQRYEDTSLVVFRQAQNKLKRQLAYTTSETDAARNEGTFPGHRFANLFRRRSRSKTTQSAICVIF